MIELYSMATIRQRNDPVKLLVRRLMLFCLFLFVIFVSTGVWNIYQKERESQVLKEEARMQLADLQARQSELAERIAELKTDRGTEVALREQYSMGRSGEQLIIITSTQKPAEPEATTTPILQKWMHKVFWWW